KDGRTHLAHKAEHAVDLETGAIVGVTVQDADAGDTTSLVETLTMAADQLAVVAPTGLVEVVADKGYHSNQTMAEFADMGIRSYVSEPDRGRRNWTRKAATRDAVYANRRRIRGVRGSGCCGSGVSDWNAPTRISTRRAGCAACICGDTPTFSSGCSFTSAASTSGCSCAS
ncbi:MAG: transposase, partial [Acidobacteria bacterium]|nr:transposase [Acidobacteriota bacterium]